jgi:hypothetical protein
MRDLVAGILALVLLFVAMSLSTTLHWYRRRRERVREREAAMGRRVIAELPTADELVLVTDDEANLYYRTETIDKAAIIAIRVLINGAPIAAYVSTRHSKEAAAREPTGFEDRPEGIARDRWDVAVETASGTTLIECGAIRERVSQELARAIFDTLKSDLETRDAEASRRPPFRSGA